MLNRREFLCGSLATALATPLPIGAQPPGKVYRIGMLETRSVALNAANLDAFRRGLRELGYREGHNLVIDYRSSDGRDDRFPGLASEMVHRDVDVILTRGTPAALAAKQATRTIPVVMAGSGDPVASGLVATLGHPSGNVTGMSSLIADLNAKRVELLSQVLPKPRRVAVIFNMGNPVIPRQWMDVETTARTLGMETQLLDVRRPEDLRSAFDAATKQGAEALFVGVDGVTQTSLQLIAEFVTRQRLPSVYGAKEYVNFGGLMTYGVSDEHMYHRAATFVDRIFKGAKPGDLPVEQPTKVELVINMRAATALGLTIPQSLLLRADQVIE